MEYEGHQDPYFKKESLKSPITHQMMDVVSVNAV